MSAIDQVIARARMAGDIGFTERRQFKLARSRAIEKLRRFALADPYFYILELIQSAIASGATWVDIGCGERNSDDVRVSWTGGAHLREAELGALFDFLFAAKDRVDIAQTRSLALGVNALMLFAPTMIVIESGDGSEGGTTRMVIRQGIDQVDVGKAEGVLHGTYVRAIGLDRAKVARETHRAGTREGGLEYATIELRCLAAPVPIVFNGESMFGWSSQKIPRIAYEKRVEIDEGDLYGVLGLNPRGGPPSFQLLTHGVWVQSYTHELVPKQLFGGILCFNRLRKTVDHSGFVRDEVFEELWIRLAPYAQQLLGGGDVDNQPKILGAGGNELSVPELRALLAEHPRVLAVPAKLDAKSEAFERARSLAQLLDAELLRVPDTQQTALRVLGGRELLIFRPSLAAGTDELVYARPATPEPSGPALLPPATLDSLTSLQLIEQLGPAAVERKPGEPPPHQGRALLTREALGRAIGETGSCTATLYAPLALAEARDGLLVRIMIEGRRLIESLLLPSAWAGRVLDIVLPTCSPFTLAHLGRRSGVDLYGAIAGVFLERARPLLLEQDRRTLAGLGVGTLELGSPAAKLAVQTLARTLVTRVRSTRVGRASLGLAFSLLHDIPHGDPLALPLLRTVSGRNPIRPDVEGLSVRDLALLSDLGGGLVYGVVPDVEADLEGLDPDRILALDRADERHLVGLLGESGYVRIDARDEIARVEFEGRRFVVRDIALGLHDYGDFPVLLEPGGDDPSGLDGERLLDALIIALRGRLLAPPGPDRVASEELRRHALRHLQWTACRVAALGQLERRPELAALPLFLDHLGQAWSLAALLPSLRGAVGHGGLIVHYAHGLGAAELGVLAEAITHATPHPPDAQLGAIACSGFLVRLLAGLGRIRIAGDFDLDDHEAKQGTSRVSEAMLVRETVELAGARCTFGVPSRVPDDAWLPVYEREPTGLRAIGLIEPPFRGMVGLIEVDERTQRDTLVDALERELPCAGQRLLEALLARLPELEGAGREREHQAALCTLFEHAAAQLSLLGEPGLMHVQVGSALADRVLGLPLFDVGGATLVGARRLLDHFRRTWMAAPDPSALPSIDWARQLGPHTPTLLREWLLKHVQANRVTLIASRSRSPALAEREPPSGSRAWRPGQPFDEAALAWNLNHWLAELRPDPRECLLDESDASSVFRRPPTRMWLMLGGTDEGTLFEGADHRLEIDATRPIVLRAIHEPSASHFAWLLLAVYAHLNTVTVSITNAHEQEFQRRVAAALLEGRLQLFVAAARDTDAREP